MVGELLGLVVGLDRQFADDRQKEGLGFARACSGHDHQVSELHQNAFDGFGLVDVGRIEQQGFARRRIGEPHVELAGALRQVRHLHVPLACLIAWRGFQERALEDAADLFEQLPALAHDGRIGDVIGRLDITQQGALQRLDRLLDGRGHLGPTSEIITLLSARAFRTARRVRRPRRPLELCRRRGSRRGTTCPL